MAKRVFIVHGWDGYPKEGWYPWLKKELEAKGFEVRVPRLPEANKPRIHTWVPALAQAVGTPNGQTYFVGHSMGCQTIARYAEALPKGVSVGGAVFVGGFFKRLTGLEDTPDVQETARHWLTAPIDFKNIKSHLKESVAIFSDDDPYVPLDNQEDFKEKLGSKIIIEHKMKHFAEHDGVTELPVALKELLKMAGNPDTLKSMRGK
jgi:predicted alpha/beta hydrolase family esterase